MSIFLLLAILMRMIYDLLTDNIYNAIFISFFSIICYRLFTYLILILTGTLTFHIEVLFLSISSSLIINIVYLFVFYYGTRFFIKKSHIRLKNNLFK